MISLKANTPEVEQFINDFVNMTETHPLDPKARILDNCSILLVPFGDRVHISAMDSLIRGSGTIALTKLCDLADQHQVTISLLAKGYSITPTKRLLNWYIRFGFIQTGVGSEKEGYRMIREPKPKPIKLMGFNRLH